MVWLEQLRLARKWSQVDAGEACKINRATYSLIETGRYKPSKKQKANIEKVFGFPFEKLMDEVKVEILEQALATSIKG